MQKAFFFNIEVKQAQMEQLSLNDEVRPVLMLCGKAIVT